MDTTDSDIFAGESDDARGPGPIDTPPAAGERRAIVGYHGQYAVGAHLVAQALEARTLDWIRVADPEAGRVDDLQLGSPGRLDAYQIKWSQYPGHLTFSALTASSGDDQSLVRQLADGWTRLKTAHPDRRVVVHLITNETPSPSVAANLPVTDPGPQPPHFAAFLAQAWKPCHESPFNSVPGAWCPAWDVLREASRLDADVFEAFVADCELDLGWQLPRAGASATPEERQANEDIDHIEQSLFATVADPARPVQLSREQLLERLGWQGRFRAGRYHDFPMPRIYEPVQETVGELGLALDQLTGGYLALLGSPGSGKSTLLTHVLRMRRERVIRYYAFVPDYRDTSRAESASFLSDLVVTIENAGFRPGGRPSQPDAAALVPVLQKQLQMLHEDYESQGRRTIILVDGLDHVPRLNPHRPFLRDLPFPVPDGVVVLVGSQTDGLQDLPSGVRSEIQHAGRSIVMQALSMSAVDRVLAQSGLDAHLSGEQRAKVHQLCSGHPLALRYLLNELGQVPPEDIPKVLRRMHPYGQDIAVYYAEHWDEFSQEAELAALLGLLARLRRPFDLAWLRQWPESGAIPRLVAQLRRYFVDEGGKWSFFHDSFRQFVLDRTAQPLPGEPPSYRDAQLHALLAERCREAPPDHPNRWEELHHLCSAGKHDEVLSLATQSWFRSQFLRFRPHHAIREDILAALRSAGECQDPVALTRLVLAGAEVSQREFQFSGLQLPSLLLRSGQADTAFEHVRTGYRLHLVEEAGLKFAAEAYAAGHESEAKRVFELAEPIRALHGDTTATNASPQEHVELLEVWASVATRFLSLDQVIETISGVEAPEYRFNQQRMPPEQLRCRMLFAAGISLLQQRRWDEFEMAATAVEQYDTSDEAWWFWLHVHAWRQAYSADEPRRAEGHLDLARRHVDIVDFDDDERIALAEGVYRVAHDEAAARELIASCPQPAIVEDFSAAQEEGLGPYVRRFALNRLLAAIGEGLSPEEVVPDAEDPRLEGLVHFERGLVSLGQLHGRVWRETFTPADFMSTAQPLLRLFNRDWSGIDHLTGWHSILGLRTEFYKRLVHAAEAHGPSTVADLRRGFEEGVGSTSDKAVLARRTSSQSRGGVGQ